jgi:hypothetical protein
MKKAFTIFEFLLAIILGIVLFTLAYFWIGGMGDYSMKELFWTEQIKIKYQREMVEELRRANELKEYEIRNQR